MTQFTSWSSTSSSPWGDLMGEPVVFTDQELADIWEAVSYYVEECSDCVQEEAEVDQLNRMETLMLRFARERPDLAAVLISDFGMTPRPT